MSYRRTERRFATLGLLLLVAAVSPSEAQERSPTDAPDLAELLRISRAASPDLARWRARTAAAVAGLEAAAPAPPLTFAAEIENIPDGVKVGDAQQMRATLERPVLRGSRVRAARAAATAARELVVSQAALAGLRVDANVRRAAIGLLGWQAIAERLAAADTLLALAVDALSARFASGEATYLEVLRLRTARLQLTAERVEALANAAERRADLLIPLTGHDTLARRADSLLLEWTANRRWTELSAPGPSAADADSLVRQALRARAAVAERDVDLVRADRSTTASAFAGVQRFTDQNGAFTVGPSVGLSVSLPFTASGSTRALVGAAQAHAESIRRDAAADAAELQAAIARVRARARAATERIAVFDAALLTGAREEREAALSSFRAGRLTLIEFLDFERALARIEVDRLRAIIDASDAQTESESLPADLLLSGPVALEGAP